LADYGRKNCAQKNDRTAKFAFVDIQNTSSAIQILNTSVIKTFRQRFRNWAFRRTYETGTVTLNQRRIYILPTSQGIGFGCVLVLMLLGDINYGLSLGYVLTFLLATASGMSMLFAFRNLAQLEIRAGHIESVFVGEQSFFIFYFNNPSSLTRYQIHLHDDAGHHTVFDLHAQHHTEVQLALPATHRGWLDSERLTIFTDFPFGLFHAWTYIHFDVRCLVYPKPAAPQPLPVSSSQDGSGKLFVAGDEDFSGLRNYVTGDAMPRIAWKALAREQGLQVKQFSSLQGKSLWLDWAQLPNIATERKLEILARWVLDCDAQGLLYGLRLPDVEVMPQNNPTHRAECLRRLALFGFGTA
jgi:uncharacterized protein (DUF58 family)